MLYILKTISYLVYCTDYNVYKSTNQKAGIKDMYYQLFMIYRKYCLNYFIITNSMENYLLKYFQQKKTFINSTS